MPEPTPEQVEELAIWLHSKTEYARGWDACITTAQTHWKRIALALLDSPPGVLVDSITLRNSAPSTTEVGYTTDDDGIHLTCRLCGLDTIAGFGQTVADLESASRHQCQR